MPKFSIAFIAPAQQNQLKHVIMESPDRDTALKTFFAKEVVEYYSNDEQGYFYFKEDFLDSQNAMGNIIQCE